MTLDALEYVNSVYVKAGSTDGVPLYSGSIWDYPYSSFTDIYENCYDDGFNGDFDIRTYYIFCNDKCDMIEIDISKKVLDSIALYKQEDLDSVESLKNKLTK